MRLLHYLFCFLLSFSGMAVSTEYTYPVASLDNGTIILYIHQTSPQSIELFEWNRLNDNVQPILWSLFNPGGIALLSHDQGFSFIDNGRLRIKQFCKRSPKTIDFDEPIFNIQGVQWIDEHTCYCSAQHGDHFSLFELNDNGTLNYLMREKDKDCMYPQKIDNHLFYITRSKIAHHYCIAHTKYDKNSQFLPQIIIDFEHLPIMFLHMISAEEGFVLGYKNNLECTDATASFFYHHLIKKGDNWHNHQIFSFEIPRYLLLDDSQRLFESILPLLPRIIDNSIYYVDCSGHQHNYLEPYSYDLLSGKSKKLNNNQNHQGHLFVPMKCGNELYCGGSKQAQKPLISFLT